MAGEPGAAAAVRCSAGCSSRDRIARHCGCFKIGYAVVGLLMTSFFHQASREAPFLGVVWQEGGPDGRKAAKRCQQS